MGLAPQLITEVVYKRACNRVEKVGKDSRIGKRLRAIISAKEEGVGVVARVFGITGATLRNWVKKFKEGDWNNLEYKQGRGRKNKITEEHLQAISEWIEQDSNLTIKKVLKKLEEKFGLKTSKSVVHRGLGKLKLSYITPRPKHYKQDPEQQTEFKKKSKGNDRK
jgi:transposase